MKDKDKQEKAKMVQEVADDKIAERKGTAKEKRTGQEGKRRQRLERVRSIQLIELLEERPSLEIHILIRILDWL